MSHQHLFIVGDDEVDRDERTVVEATEFAQPLMET
jgi:hypothetical protein